MPIYEYQHSGATFCEHCAVAFEMLQKLSDPPLTLCPRCLNPVHRMVSSPSLATPAPSLKTENLEKHGFTQFKKVEKGVYEKSAGAGPDFITANQKGGPERGSE